MPIFKRNKNNDKIIGFNISNGEKLIKKLGKLKK